MLNASKHTLSQSLAEERAAAEKAGSEARELGQRLQGCKANIHVSVPLTNNCQLGLTNHRSEFGF